MGKSWFVCCTRPQQETRAAIELANQQFETFLPVLNAKPMYPRYIFVRFDRESDPWGAIRSTRGCVDLLKDGYLPSPVPDRAMDAIRAYRPTQEAPQPETIYSKGQVVRIIDGPAEGLEGIFDGDAKKRTIAFLKMMGRRTSIPMASIRAA